MPKFLFYLFLCLAIFFAGCADASDETNETDIEAGNISDDTPEKLEEDAAGEDDGGKKIIEIPSCDDNNECTGDVLNERTGKCEHKRLEICCGDGFCDFSERCNDDAHTTVCPLDCPRTCAGVLTLSEFSCEGSCSLNGENFIITGSSILKTQMENIGELPLSSLSSSFECRQMDSNVIHYDEKNEDEVYNNITIKDYFEGDKNKVVLKGNHFPNNTALYYLEISGVPEKTRLFLCTIRFTGGAVYSSTEIKLNFETESL